MKTQPLPKDMQALLPVEKIVTDYQRAAREADLRTALFVVAIIAVMGWAAFFAAVAIAH